MTSPFYATVATRLFKLQELFLGGGGETPLQLPVNDLAAERVPAQPPHLNRCK